MKGKEEVAPLPAAVIYVLDRYAGIFRGRWARLSRAPAAARFAREPLTAASRPQDGRRAIKDGPAFTGQVGARPLLPVGKQRLIISKAALTPRYRPCRPRRRTGSSLPGPWAAATPPRRCGY